MFNIGPEELILILVIALIVFGPKRLPEIGRTIGKSLREFRRASEGFRDGLQGLMEEEPPAVSPGPPTAAPEVRGDGARDGQASARDGQVGEATGSEPGPASETPPAGGSAPTP